MRRYVDPKLQVAGQRSEVRGKRQQKSRDRPALVLFTAEVKQTEGPNIAQFQILLFHFNSSLDQKALWTNRLLASCFLVNPVILPQAPFYFYFTSRYSPKNTDHTYSSDLLRPSVAYKIKSKKTW